VFDANGRFNPTFNEQNVEDIPATHHLSIGQSSDLSFLQPDDGVESNRGLIKVDPETYQTTAPMSLPAATCARPAPVYQRHSLRANCSPLHA